MRIESFSFQYPPVRPSRASLAEPIGSLRVLVRMKGTYEQLKEYVSDLETNIRLIDVQTLRIEGGGIAGQESLIYNLVLDVYYQTFD